MKPPGRFMQSLVSVMKSKPLYFVTGGFSTLRAGVGRPCDTTELMTTSWNFSLCRRVEKVCFDRQLIGYS